jgi:toxin ParE1/3/4
VGLKVSLHRRAEQDLRNIREHLLQHAGGRVADRVRMHLLGKIGRLESFPSMGRPTSTPGIRILPPTRYPYRIYYAVTSDRVVVLHVRHNARRDPALGDL